MDELTTDEKKVLNLINNMKSENHQLITNVKNKIGKLDFSNIFLTGKIINKMKETFKNACRKIKTEENVKTLLNQFLNDDKFIPFLNYFISLNVQDKLQVGGQKCWSPYHEYYYIYPKSLSFAKLEREIEKEEFDEPSDTWCKKCKKYKKELEEGDHRTQSPHVFWAVPAAVFVIVLFVPHLGVSDALVTALDLSGLLGGKRRRKKRSNAKKRRKAKSKAKSHKARRKTKRKTKRKASRKTKRRRKK